MLCPNCKSTKIGVLNSLASILICRDCGYQGDGETFAPKTLRDHWTPEQIDQAIVDLQPGYELVCLDGEVIKRKHTRLPIFIRVKKTKKRTKRGRRKRHG